MLNKSESIKNIAIAMAKVQSEVKQPLKDKENPFYKSAYVPLEGVVQAITDIAPNHGISFTQFPVNSEQNQTGIATLLMHESGEFIEYPPFFMKADKDTPQANGAILTYNKRYVLSAIFGITSDEDDDANSVSGNNSAPKQAPKTTPKAPEVLTMTQKNEINKKSKEYIKIRGKGSIKELFDHLKISDLDKITPRYAVGTIKSLDLMIAKAKEQADE